MNQMRIAALALLLGAGSTASALAQSPGYGPPPGSGQEYDRQDSDYRDDRYENDRYDDDRYGDDRYDDDIYYNTGNAPRGDVGFFFDELSPYGDWIFTRDYGWAWFPRDVHPRWRPYSDGRWVNSDYGWTWASYEPFGWATYHYGRWDWDRRFGWLWFPGTVWGPAWVSWQHGNGYVGWAPLPPRVGFEIGVGIRLGGFNLSVGIRPDSYSFVPERSFLEPRLSGYLIPMARNVSIIHNTTNITNYTWVDNRVVNQGVEVRRIEQVTGRRVKPLRVAEARVKSRTEVAENEIRIYRPEKRQLESVRETPRMIPEPKIETAPRQTEANRPPSGKVTRREVGVAPRVNPKPNVDAQQIERQERRAAQELEKYQAEEKRELARIQAQEIAKSRAAAERAEVQKHHQAERAALQKEQREAAAQLEARQKAQRQAIKAAPAGAKPSKGAQDAAKDQSKQKKQKESDSKKNDEGRKPGDKSESLPPPGRA